MHTTTSVPAELIPPMTPDQVAQVGTAELAALLALLKTSAESSGTVQPTVPAGRCTT